MQTSNLPHFLVKQGTQLGQNFSILLYNWLNVSLPYYNIY